MPIIHIDKIIKSNKRKSFKIEIDNNAYITIKVPHYANRNDIEEFISNNIVWITNTMQKISNKSKFIRKYEDNEFFLFLGQNIPLKIVNSNDNFHNFFFKYDGNNFFINSNSINLANKYFEKFYKTQAKKIIIPRVEDIARKLKINYNKIKITSATTRWGSCNSQGNVNFSWRLIMAPPIVIDYVIIHEFCHLFEFNHSKKFWELVEKIMPDYNIQKKWLNDNSMFMVL
jgi:predicted metal-dependent hydrolase